jgi:hypothetical protein
MTKKTCHKKTPHKPLELGNLELTENTPKKKKKQKKTKNEQKNHHFQQIPI